jgi:two-component system sensor histidine kinase YesM
VKKKKLRGEMSVLLLFCVIFGILLTFFFVVRNVTGAVFQHQCETGVEVLKQTRSSLASMLDDAEFLSVSVLGSEPLNTFLRSNYDDSTAKALEQYRLHFTFSSLFNSRAYLDSICIYDDDGILLQFGSLVSSEVADRNADIRARKGRIRWTAAEYYPNQINGRRGVPVVSLYRAVNDLYAMRQLAYMRVSIKESALCGCYSPLVSEDGASVFILNGDGDVVSSDDKGKIGRNYAGEAFFPEIAARREGYFLRDGLVYSFYEIENRGWYVVKILPREKLMEGVVPIRNTLLLSMFLCVALVVVFFVLQRRAVRVEEAYRSKLLNREMELKYLQGQINPHFLYNTLDTIRWMAVKAGQEPIAQQIKALSDIFRHTLNRGQEYTSVRAEIDHVRKYMFIQQNRFSETLGYDIEIDAKCLDATVPHLILQPIVENAVVHGLDGLDGPGKIFIRVYAAGEDLFYEVSDNGVGFDPADVRRKMGDPAETHEVFALKNIDERIKLVYGEGYGLTLESEPGKGSKITVKMKLDR